MLEIIKFFACGLPGAVHYEPTPDGGEVAKVYWGGAGLPLDSIDESCAIKAAAEAAIERSA